MATREPAELAALVGAGETILLDVRREADAAADQTRIPGALRCAPENLDACLAALPEGAAVGVYCVRGGSVSDQALEKIAASGRAGIKLAGGLAAWKAAGLDLVGTTPAEEARLREVGMAEDDLRHSGRVAAAALWIAGLVKAEQSLDRERIRVGAVYHDLGKIDEDTITHGLTGARIAFGMGLPEAAARGALVHVRAGVPPEEAHERGLPAGDYRPRDHEERIVILADKLTDMVEDGYAPDLPTAWRDFTAILRANPKLHKDESSLARYLAHRNTLGEIMENPA